MIYINYYQRGIVMYKNTIVRVKKCGISSCHAGCYNVSYMVVMVTTELMAALPMATGRPYGARLNSFEIAHMFFSQRYLFSRYNQ